MAWRKRLFLLLGLGGAGGLTTCVTNLTSTIQAAPDAATNLQAAAFWIKGKAEPMLTGSTIGGTAMVLGFGGAALLLAQPYVARRFPRLAGLLPGGGFEALPRPSYRELAPTLADKPDSRVLAPDTVHRRLEDVDSRVRTLSEQLSHLTIIVRRQNLKEVQGFLASVPGMISSRGNASPEHLPEHFAGTRRKLQRISDILKHDPKHANINASMVAIDRNLDFDISKGKAKYSDKDWTLLERQCKFLTEVAETIERELDGVPPAPLGKPEPGATT